MSILSTRIILSNPVQRILTGLVLACIILFILSQKSVSLLAFFLVIVSTIASYEWAHIVGYERVVYKSLYTVAIFVLTSFAVILNEYLNIELVSGLALIYILLCCLCIVNEERGIPQKFNLLGLWKAGGLIIIPASSLSLIVIFKLNILCLGVLLLIVCSIDTFCYIGGKLLGKNKLVPIISPNKTREGLYVGFIVSFLILFLLNFTTGFLKLDMAIIIYLVIFFSAIMGDLNVSIMKRKSGKKNTGRIFPGHGGVLDRIDSIIFAAPSCIIILSLFEKI